MEKVESENLRLFQMWQSALAEMGLKVMQDRMRSESGFYYFTPPRRSGSGSAGFI